jgi:signal transduction histidine kinase
MTLLSSGPFGIGFLRPYNLFGLEGLDPLSHAVFWSMLVNVGGLILGSLFSHRSALERVQAELFVDVYRRGIAGGDSYIWRGTASIEELRALVVRFIGRREGAEFYRRYSAGRSDQSEYADSGVVQEAERLLAGAIGAASARVMVASVVKGETLGIDEVMTILDETSQIIVYSHRLEEKSRQLERATEDLQAANQRLQDLDRLKDEFVSTVTHELRTPLTSIRAFSEILLSDPALDTEQRSEFLGIIVKETERLTRLINDVLDFSKIESGRIDWHMESLKPQALIEDAVQATSQLFKDRSVVLDVQLPKDCQRILGDSDRLMQVLINLLSNAVKFCADVKGRVHVGLEETRHGVLISVADNGPGVPAAEREVIFDQFHQVQEKNWGKPKGTGLGLAISLRIVEHHKGRIWVESADQGGARFWLELPADSGPGRRGT